MNQPSRTPASEPLRPAPQGPAPVRPGLHRRGQAAALAAALLFSTGGMVLKAGVFSGLQLSGFRSAIAGVALALWVGRRLRVSVPILGAAVAYAATLTLFVTSTRLTTAAAAIFLQSTAPLFLAVLGPLWLHEPLHRRDGLPLVLLALGLGCCLLGYPAATLSAPNPVLGNVLGVASGLAWACTLAGLRGASLRHGPDAGMSAVVLGNLLAAAVALPFAFPVPAGLGWVDLAQLLYLGLVQVAIAYMCLTVAVRHLPAFEVSLLLLIEPVLNPLWTWWFRGESPGGWVVVGGTCIVIAAALRAGVARGARPARHGIEPA